MNGTDVADQSAVGTRNNNGILQYMSVDRRGNYLVPPRDCDHRSPAATRSLRREPGARARSPLCRRTTSLFEGECATTAMDSRQWTRRDLLCASGAVGVGRARGL